MIRWVAFDRDGTLIADKHYLHEPEGVELLPGAVEAISQLRGLGLKIVMVTNQSGVGRGYFPLSDVQRVNARVVELLGPLDGIYICPHAPAEECRCRKPLPGLLEQAAAELGLDPRECVVVGDKAADVGLAHAAGGLGVLVTTGYGAETARSGAVAADFVAADLSVAAAWIASKIG